MAVAVIAIAAATATANLKGMKEQKKRSIVKTLTWRATGTMDTFLLSLLITNDTGSAGMIAGAEVFTKMILYYFHERAWNKFKFGLQKPKEPDYQI